jgi:hypothetical protein
MVEFTSRFLFTLMFYCHHLFDLSYLFAIYISLQTECSWNISPTYATIGVNPPDLGMCAQIIGSRANWRLANQEVLCFCLQRRMVARGWPGLKFDWVKWVPIVPVFHFRVYLFSYYIHLDCFSFWHIVVSAAPTLEVPYFYERSNIVCPPLYVNLLFMARHFKD